MASIIWLSEQNIQPTNCNDPHGCLVCGSQGLDAYVEIDGPSDHIGTQCKYVFYKCRKCFSLTSHPTPPSNEVAYGNTDDSQIYHYVDVGSGIQSMLQLLGTIKPNGNLVEVGCGFGYVLDYWRFSGNQKYKSIGIDESRMSLIGRDVLKLDIRSPLSELHMDERGDIVAMFEVIEHTTNPLEFLDYVKSNLAKEHARYILSTPAAEFINPKSTPEDVVSALSPGFHTCVFSKVGLEFLLSSVSQEFSVKQNRERLDAMFGKIQEPNHGNAIKNSYCEYLRHLGSHNNKRIGMAAKFRLFKELVNDGEVNEANEIKDQLINYLFSLSGEQMSPLTSDKYLSSIVGSANRHLEHYPAWYSIFRFYLAQHFRNSGKPRLQAAYLEASLFELKNEVDLSTMPTNEAASLINVGYERMIECRRFITHRYGTSEKRRLRKRIQIKFAKSLKVKNA
jgi:hypothetical protein